MLRWCKANPKKAVGICVGIIVVAGVVYFCPPVAAAIVKGINAGALGVAKAASAGATQVAANVGFTGITVSAPTSITIVTVTGVKTAAAVVGTAAVIAPSAGYVVYSECERNRREEEQERFQNNQQTIQELEENGAEEGGGLALSLQQLGEKEREIRNLGDRIIELEGDKEHLIEQANQNDQNRIERERRIDKLQNKIEKKNARIKVLEKNQARNIQQHGLLRTGNRNNEQNQNNTAVTDEKNISDTPVNSTQTARGPTMRQRRIIST